MKNEKLKHYEFLQAISDTIGTAPTMAHYLKQLPIIMEKYLPIKRIIVFYRSETGNRFSPYPEVVDNNPVIPLDEQSNIIRSFVTHHSAMFLDSNESIYHEIFNKNSDQLLDKYQLNLLIPLHCRRYYRGLLVGWMDPKKRGLIKEVEKLIQAAAHLFIPIIETERLEVENDRNYYRLFKFDRLVLMGEMVASIAHELKTPMNTVLLEVQEINDQLGNIGHSGLTSSCQKIKNEIHRVSQFIRSLLSFSKFKEIAVEEIALNDFVVEALAEIPRKRIPEALDITTRLENDHTLPIDRNRLRQVFFNILFNAFDAAGAHGKIAVKTYAERKEIDKNARHIISIRDDGPGIPADIKDKVLEPFFTTKSEGTGLGLYISYGIMRSIKGDLEIESNNEGTTVYIILPGGK